MKELIIAVVLIVIGVLIGYVIGNFKLIDPPRYTYSRLY